MTVSQNQSTLQPRQQAQKIASQYAAMAQNVAQNASEAKHPLTYVPYFDGAKKLREYPQLMRESQEYQRAANDTTRYRLYVHRDMLKIVAKRLHFGFSKPSETTGTRGPITRFSRKSRKRMFEFIASQRHGSPDTFLTLTYPDEAQPVGKIEMWRSNFEALRRRLEREFGEEFRMLWKIEPQTRKSGIYTGRIVPHFHGLVWLPDTFKQKRHFTNGGKEIDFVQAFGIWLQTAWHEIVGTGEEKHYENGTHVSPVRNMRHAYHYVSKYCGKEDEIDEDLEMGRRWGRIGDFITAASEEVELTRAEMVHLKRLLSSWLKSKKSYYAKRLRQTDIRAGFSVFGLGDNEQYAVSRIDSEFWRFLIHASRLADINPDTRTKRLCWQ